MTVYLRDFYIFNFNTGCYSSVSRDLITMFLFSMFAVYVQKHTHDTCQTETYFWFYITEREHGVAFFKSTW